MILREVNATFGLLRDAALSPGPGLTVITGHNESGKSTWCALLKTLFYGLPLRERTRADFLPDRLRYQPWSGEAMSVSARLEHNGRTLVFQRSGGSSGKPLQTLRVYDAVSGQDIPVDGEDLLGVPREVYLRTAFVQGDLLVGRSDELHSRLMALVTTGGGGVPFQEAVDRLKKEQNRRRSHSSGVIPKREQELRDVLAASQKAAGLSRRELELRAQLREAEKRLAEVRASAQERTAAALRRWQEEQAAARAAAILDAQELRDAETALENDAPPAFTGLTAPEARRKAFADADIAKQWAGQEQASRLPRLGRLAGLLILPVASALFIRQLGLALPYAWVYGALAGLALDGFLLWRGRSKRPSPQMTALLAAYGTADAVEILEQCAAYEKLYNMVHFLRQAASRQTPPPPPLPTDDPDTGDASAHREQLLQQLAQLRGQAWDLDDIAVLDARREALEQEIKRLNDEWLALRLAAELLSEAETELREQFTPELSRLADRYLSVLTQGRYNELLISRDFTLLAGQRYDTEDNLGRVHRGTLEVSCGTADQMYLALRLALCDLLLPPGTPIILDDALLTFDDTRLAAALDTLREVSRKRQVLLFTCHGREAAYWKEDQTVVKINL